MEEKLKIEQCDHLIVALPITQLDSGILSEWVETPHSNRLLWLEHSREISFSQLDLNGFDNESWYPTGVEAHGCRDKTKMNTFNEIIRDLENITRLGNYTDEKSNSLCTEETRYFEDFHFKPYILTPATELGVADTVTTIIDEVVARTKPVDREIEKLELIFDEHLEKKIRKKCSEIFRVTLDQWGYDNALRGYGALSDAAMILWSLGRYIKPRAKQDFTISYVNGRGYEAYNLCVFPMQTRLAYISVIDQVINLTSEPIPTPLVITTLDRNIAVKLHQHQPDEATRQYAERLQKSRSKKSQQLAKILLGESTTVTMDRSVAQEQQAEQKRKAREFYRQRMIDRGQIYEKTSTIYKEKNCMRRDPQTNKPTLSTYRVPEVRTRTVNEQISPYLLEATEDLYKYSLRHKCPHGRAYQFINRKGKRPAPGCSHIEQKQIFKVGLPCLYCEGMEYYLGEKTGTYWCLKCGQDARWYDVVVDNNMHHTPTNRVSSCCRQRIVIVRAANIEQGFKAEYCSKCLEPEHSYQIQGAMISSVVSTGNDFLTKISSVIKTVRDFIRVIVTIAKWRETGVRVLCAINEICEFMSYLAQRNPSSVVNFFYFLTKTLTDFNLATLGMLIINTAQFDIEYQMYIKEHRTPLEGITLHMIQSYWKEWGTSFANVLSFFKSFIPTTQIQYDIGGLAGKIRELFIGSCAFLTPPKVVMDGVKALNDLFRLKTNVMENCNFFCEPIARFFYWLGAHRSASLYIDYEMKYGSNLPVIVDRINKHLVTMEGNNVAPHDRKALIKEIMEMIDEWVLSVPLGVRYEPRFIRLIDELRKPLYKNYDFARSCPFVIKISGPPGIGKSTIAPILLSAIYEDKTLAQLNAMMYSRNPASEYWDGYDNKTHRVILYDDFGQSRDEVDIKEIIGLVSNAPYKPPMASLNDPAIGVKGIEATPEVVILCSNVHEHNPITVMSPQAVNRRKHIDIVVEWADPNYRQTCSDLSHMKIMVCDKEKNKYVHSLPALLQHINSEFKAYTQHATQLESDLTKLMYNSSTTANRPMKVAESTEIQNIDELIAAYEVEISNALRDEQTSLDERARAAASARAEIAKLETRKSALRLINHIQGDESVTPKTRTLRQIVADLDSGELEILRHHLDLEARGRRTTVLSRVISILHDALDITKNFLIAVIGGVSGVIACMLTVTLLMKSMGTSIQSSDNMGVKAVKVVKNGAIQHSLGEQKQLRDAVRKVGNAICKISSPAFAKTHCFISDTNIIAPRHVFSNPLDGSILEGEYELTNVNKRFTIKVVKEIVTEFGDNDIVVVNFQRQLPAFPSLRKMFAHYEDQPREGAELRGYHFRDEYLEPFCEHFLRSRVRLEYDIHHYAYTCAETFMYSGIGVEGDCGKPLITIVDGIPRIIGMHIGIRNLPTGVQSMGLYLAGVFATMKIEVAKDFEPHLGVIEPTSAPEYGQGIFVLGTHQPPFQSRKTALRPSPLFDQVQQHTTEPAYLGKDAEIPAINKYAFIKRQMPQDLVDRAVESIKEEVYGLRTSDDVCRPLTWKEVINGIPNHPYITPMAMDTSAGYPHVLLGRTGPKRSLFEGEPGSLRLKEPYMQEIIEIEQQMAEGSLPFLPFVATLKDERRPLEKVQAKKTRVFAASPLALTMIARRWKLPFCAFSYRVRNQCYFSTGMDKHGGEWDTWYNHLAEVGEDFAADKDYATFDGTLVSNVLEGAQSVTNDYLECDVSWKEVDPQVLEMSEKVQKNYRKIQKCLDLAQAESVQLHGDKIIMVSNGMPSGFITTNVEDSTSGEINERVYWQSSMPHPWNSLYYYRKHVRTTACGDDNVICMSREAAAIYDLPGFATFMAEYGVTVTRADKQPGVLTFRHLTDMDFLKCKTRKWESEYVPLMHKEAILETSNWIRKNKYFTADELCEINCNMILRPLFFWGPEEFAKIRRKILECKPSYNLLDFMTLYQAWKTGTNFDPFGTGFNTQHGEHLPVIEGRLMSHNRILTGCDIKIQMEQQPISNKTIDREQQRAIDETDTQPAKLGLQNLDSASYKRDQGEGMTLAMQAVSSRSTTISKPILTAERAASHMPDHDWNLARILARNTFVANVPWAITDDVNTKLFSYNVPMGMVLSNTIRTPFNQFVWFRFKTLRAKFQVVSSRFHQGRVMVGYDPSFSNLGTGADISLTRLSQLDPVFLDPSAATAVELVIPWRFDEDWISLNDPANQLALGQIYGKVQSKLASASTAATSATIKIFVQFEGAQFRLPKRLPESIGEFTIQGLFEDAGKQVGGAIDNELEILFTEEIPNMITTDLLGAVLDKPQTHVNPTRTRQRFVGDLGTAVGPEDLASLQLYPEAQYLTDVEHFGTSQDEMKMDFLLKEKRTYIDKVSWSTTDTVGTILYTTKIGPNFSLLPVATEQNIDLMSYVSSMFRFWRGSIILEIDVVSSQFHEGRLDVTWHPNSLDAPAGIQQSYQQYGSSFVIRNQGNSFAVKLHDMNAVPWHQVWQGDTITALPEFQQFFSGTVAVRVGAPLFAPPTVAPNVELLFYVRAGPDFELNTIDGRGTAIQPSSGVTEDGFIIQGDFTQLPDSYPKEVVPLSTTNQARNQDPRAPLARHFGETYKDLRDICKRYHPVHVYTFDDTDPHVWAWYVSLGMAQRSYEKPNMINKIGAMYRAFRGPLCFKFLSNASNTKFFQALYTDRDLTDEQVSDIAIMNPNRKAWLNTAAADTQQFYSASEFKVPYLSPFPITQIATEFGAVGFGASNYSPCIIETGTESSGTHMVFISFGDEARFGVFRGCPTIKIVANRVDAWPAPSIRKRM